MKPQVIDAFMLNNELDILNFRLHELNDYVDKFVIYENSWTFSGNKKPLYFKENKAMFSKFSDKIVYIKSDTQGKDNWKREYAQRYEVLLKGVSSLDLNDSDIVSFCDLDEIIDPKLILNYKEELPSDAPLLVCPHWFNVSWDCYLGAWDHYSIIFSYWGELKKRMNRWKGMQCGWRWDHPKFPQPIRRQELSGWHTSWFMKPQDLIIKLQSFAHNGEEWVNELLQNIDLVKDRLKSGFDIQGKNKSKKFDQDYPFHKDYISYD
jgi:beta-1,4-mannosyl-glycoprotein beta-1,4-N-acetylglucosaminyltransferase